MRFIGGRAAPSSTAASHGSSSPGRLRTRKVFLSVAREAYEWSGLAWRRHLGEGREVIEVGRYRLEIEDALVHLEVAVEPGVVRRFYDD